MEARLVETNNVLLKLSPLESEQQLADFCGTSVTLTDESSRCPSLARKTVYLCGDITKAAGLEDELKAAARVFVVRELSHDDADNVAWPVVGVGRVPILVHGVGVLYRRFFEPELDLFNQIRAEHNFQSLTQSNKPGKAHRTGIYLTPVEREGEALRFRLLRCSTNLSGPTANFGPSDRRIVEALNEEAGVIFAEQAPLNHVLAQLYWNTPATATKKQTKAKINGHADKTKDMPGNAIMAFCTFYDQAHDLQPLANDPFDRGYRNTSGLTRLHFRLKKPVAKRHGCKWKRNFDVTLYPNSVFYMPLSTNRLYTHEIRPAGLDVERIPTRMGYVVRCSTREAVHESGRTYLDQEGTRVELEPPTREGLAELRRLYAEENHSDNFIDYGDGFRFSMNQGDYAKPEFE